MSRAVPERIRRHLVGADGPEVTITPFVAWTIAPALRTWWRAEGHRFRSEDLRDTVHAIEMLAALHQARASAASAPVSDGRRMSLARGTVDSVTAEPPTVTTTEAAQRIDRSARRVRQLIDQGQLDVLDGHRPYRITLASLDRYHAGR